MIYLFHHHEAYANIDWVAISALGIAVISLATGMFVSRRTLILTKIHNKKSTEPFITDMLTAHPFKETDKESIVSYKITNSGPGPAIINKLHLIYNGEQYSNMFILINSQGILKEYKQDTSTVFTMETNHILATNEPLDLFDLHFDDFLLAMNFFNICDNVGVHIEYESMYGDVKYFEKEKIVNVEQIVGIPKK